MTNKADLFLEISVLLTGFDKAELQGTGMVETYLNCVCGKENDQTNADLFFSEVAAILKEAHGDEAYLEQAIASRLMPASAYKGLAGNLINLWYSGSWGENVVSSESYIQGLMWDVAEAHPPGAEQPGFGSWSLRPL